MTPLARRDHSDDPPWGVVTEAGRALGEALGADLLGLYVHGSLVLGDFAPGRSDLDLLAVVARPPDDEMLGRAAPVHAEIERRHPRWRGRVEVETVARSTVEAYAGSTAPGSGEPAESIMRISPGEELHLLPATPHRVLTWATVRDHGEAVVGPPARELLPAVPPDVKRAGLVAHVRDWPTWVEHMGQVGGQAYSVLSLCRAWCAVVEGEQLSKRAAADRRVVELRLRGEARDAELVAWARDWWYSGGSDDEPGRRDEVRDLVTRTSREILERDADSGDGLARRG